MSICTPCPNEENRSARKFARPPSLNGFRFLSSHAIAKSLREQVTKEMSNFQSQEIFYCEESDIINEDHVQTNEIRSDLSGIKVINTQSKASLRLEDQAIIVVEAQEELGSNNGEESVILEHIQFKNEAYIYQNTPKWPRMASQQHPKNEYRINEDSENYSDSVQDFTNSEMEINYNRQSKNTCMDRPSIDDFEGKIEKNIKSCIAKPMSRAEELEEKTPLCKNISRKEESDQFYNLRQIITKYDKHYSSASTQTNLSGEDLLQREKDLHSQISALQSKIKGLQEENLREKQFSSENLRQIATLEEQISAKEQTVEEFKMLSRKCEELEQVIALQKASREEEQSQSQNRIMFSKILSPQSLFRSGQKYQTQINRPESLLFNQPASMKAEQTHSNCRREVELLQQHIFDIEQKMEIMDMELELRAELIRQQLEQQISLKYSQEYSSMMDSLKSDLIKSRETSSKLLQQWSLKELQLKKREGQVSKMYDELLKQWQLIEHQKKVSPSPAPRSRSRAKTSQDYDLLSTFSSKNPLKQRLHTAPSIQKSNPNDFSYYYQNRQSKHDLKQIKSYRKNDKCLFQKQYNRFSDRERTIPLAKPYMQFTHQRHRQSAKNSQNNELQFINSKIKKLRSEITKELDSIH